MHKLRIKWLKLLHKRIEKALAKRRAQGKENILFLARLLAKEVKDAGYDYKGFGGFTRLDSFTVAVWDKQEIKVQSTNHGWEIRGPLHETERPKPAEPTAGTTAAGR